MFTDTCLYKLQTFLQRADNFKERQKRERKRAREREAERNGRQVRIRDKKNKPDPPSPEEVKAEKIRAANAAALSQLSSTPKFMQKFKEGAKLPSSDKGKK